MAGSVFDPLAESYDAARPSYPDGVFEALERVAGPLRGQLAVDCGAGTGIATRQLAARGARTIGLDIGERMLRRALARSPGSCCLLADGNAMPLRDGCADLTCLGSPGTGSTRAGLRPRSRGYCGPAATGRPGGTSQPPTASSGSTLTRT
jgi:SAM-dependent methyltransferase